MFPIAVRPLSLFRARLRASGTGAKKGGMAEWSKAAVLKTAEVQASVGSNPTPSANQCAARIGQ